MSDAPRLSELRVNPNPCGKPDTEDNWGKVAGYTEKFATEEMYVGSLFNSQGQAIYQNGVLVANALNINGADATGMVKVDANDNLDFLIEKFEDIGAYNADTHLLCVAATIEKTAPNGNDTIQIAGAWSSVNNHAAEGDFQLQLNAGVVSWAALGKIKVNADDATDFLEDQLNDHIESAPTQYSILKTITIDSAGDKLIRAIWDYTQETGYSATGTRVLGTVDGVLAFLEVDSSSCPGS